jgi:aryl-alcohol dehydrogenase-like predicted oxidoreductase
MINKERRYKMKTAIPIPNTGLKLFPIGLGTVGAGLDWDGTEADRIFDAYIDEGGNLIDTAHVYNDWVPPEAARSERVVGDWLSRSIKRNKVILMTKGGHPDMTVPKPDTHISRMSAKDMESDIASSLKQLRTDYIDIYFYHRDDIMQPVDELVEVMESFKKRGLIRWYGCSNWKTKRMREADEYCKVHGYRGFVANQSLLNLGLRYMKPLADDTMEAFDAEMSNYHRENAGNLAMPYMGVCSGFFHFYINGNVEAIKNSPYNTEQNLRLAERVRELTRQYHVSVSQILLAFFSLQDFDCLPLYGPQTVEQLLDALEARHLKLAKTDFEIS